MELFDEALIFACKKHSGQHRKASALPYILHPMEVASIVSTMSDSQELLAAALLHDTVEDTETSLKEVEEKFGKRVAELVMSETEDKREDRPPKETWKLRKEETLSELQSTDDADVKKLWLGDKLSNLRSFYRGLKDEGDEFWYHFHQSDPSQQEWYYRKVAESVSDLKEYDAYKEFVYLVNAVFVEKGEDCK